MTIELRIDRLVLEGLPLSAAQGALVQRAVEQELARLLAEGGLAESWHGGALPLVQAAGITLAPGGSPAEMGAQIARSIYSGLGGVLSVSKHEGRVLQQAQHAQHARGGQRASTGAARFDTPSAASGPGRSGTSRRAK